MRTSTACSRHTLLPLALCAGTLLFSTGCQSAMTSTTDHDGAASNAAPAYPPLEWPLRFTRHDFAVYCYDTYGCKVIYANRLQADDDPNELQPSSASFGPDYTHNWGGGQIAIENFPKPAEVSWRSKDGSPHHAFVDIGEIFKNQLVLHHVSRDEARLDATTVDPEISLEINDRTLKVYMRALVPTKLRQEPGNPYSDFKDELICAYSRTY